MFNLIIEAFSYDFMIRAFIVGIAISASSAFLGSFLVLKRYSMIGHGLSHVAFAAVAISLVLGSSPIFLTLPIVVLVSLMILKINQKSSVYGEAAIGLAATVAIALGTALASIGGGFKVELYSYLFGSILTIQTIDMYLAIIASLIILLLLIYHFNDLFSMTFDEDFAIVSKIKTNRLNQMLAILTGVIIALGIRAIGSVLISSFIVFPMMIAMQFDKNFKTTVIISIFSSVLLVIFGLIFSYIFDLPSGSSIVLLSGIIYLTVFFAKKLILKGGQLR
jgi:zinc transport system permease protein